MSLDIQEYEISCFCLRNTFNPSYIEFFIGTAGGKLFYFYNGWIQNTKEVIHNNAEEGPILNVQCFNDIVAWATPANIRVIHYSRKQKICIIERPKKSLVFPEYMYSAGTVKPNMTWKKDIQNNAELLYVSWFNIIKVCKITKRADDDRYSV